MIRLLLFLILLFPATCYGFPALSAGGGTTDFTADSNCMFAAYMNGSTTETDRSGEGGTLSVSAGDTIPTSSTVPTNYAGNSRDFEKSEDDWLYHADGNSTDINGANQALTICLWIKQESYASDNWACTIWDSADTHRQYYIKVLSSNGHVEAKLSPDGTNGSAVAAEGGTDIRDTNWHHIAMVYNDTDIRVYVDGSLDNNGASNPKTYAAGIYNGQEEFRVGHYGDASSGYDGLIDEVIIFDRALSATEISKIYNSGIDGKKGGKD